MLIASIAILSLLVLGFIAITILTRYPKVEDFEIKTRTSNLIIGLAYFFFFIFGIGLSVVSLVVILSTGEKSNNLVFVIVGGGFGLFALLLVLLVHSQFEAIKGNKVYIRRFIKIREYDIKNIRTIDFVMNRTYSITGVPAFGFSVDKNTIRVEQFITLLKERSDKLLSEQTSEEKEERITLAQIGKEFRDNFPTFKRKQLIANLVSTSVIMLIIAGGCLTFFLTNKKPMWLIMLIGCAVILLFFVVMIFRANSNLDKEMQNSDKWLGNKHKFDDSRVKGSAKKKFKSLLPVLIVFAVGCSVIGVICGVEGNRKPVSQSQLVAVSGEFEYIRNSGDSLQDELAIGLKGDVTEYRISKTDYSFFDLSFKKEVSVGDMVTIYIDSTRKPISVKYEGRTQWNYAYAVSANAKDYFTYDNYLVAFYKNQLATKVAFIVCVSIAGSCLLGIGASFAVYKSRSKKETLEV